MAIEILMPALSPTMEAGTLATWNVVVGDAVRSGDVIAEIETDKATMEVEAVDDGVLAVILVEAGSENVAVGTPIARLAEDGEAVDDVASAPATAAPSPPVAEAKVESSAPAAPAPVVPTPAAAPVAVPAPASAAAAAPGAGSDAPRLFASPLARRIAGTKDIAVRLHRAFPPAQGRGAGGAVRAVGFDSATAAVQRLIERADTRLT